MIAIGCILDLVLHLIPGSDGQNLVVILRLNEHWRTLVYDRSPMHEFCG